MRQDRLTRPLALAVLLGGLFAPRPLTAQDAPTLPPDSIALRDLGAFQDDPDGWRIVGGITADRRRELRIETEPGTGILANVSSPGRGEDLRTDWEHGDIDLDIDFMMPRGSNSGIYFQGRYELQLLDSWGVENPTYGDVGGIYERWDEARGEGREGYQGQAPRVNAARAPGLWQHLRVEFRAPRFDEAGNKIANARFARVELNGTVIHENVEVTGPTRGSSFPGEAATGPLRFQGDHGPVAFRRIHFKRYVAQPVRVSDLRFQAYEGEFERLPNASTLTPARSGVAEALSAAPAGVPDNFLLVQEGVLEVPAAGRYLFDLRLNWVDDNNADGTSGGARLNIGGREVLLHPGRAREASAGVELSAGRHPFTLEMFKHRQGRPASFTLFVEGPGVRRQALHEENGAWRGNPSGPIVVQPGDEPTLLRSFMNYGEVKRTRVVSVGDPSGVHYTYDSENGGLLYAWRGPFLETTEMWRGRGEPQLAAPLGSVVTLPDEPALAALTGATAAWPDSMDATAGYQFLGYDLDEVRRPVFRYRLGPATVEDRLRPIENRGGLAREIRVSAPAGTGDMYARLAAGEEIRRLRDGSWMVDGQFYVVPASGTRPVLRSVEGGQELVVPLSLRRGGATAAWEIVW